MLLVSSVPHDREIENLITILGWRSYNYQTEVKSHLATIELILSERAIEDNKADELEQEISKILNALPSLQRLQVSQQTNSPPVGVPVQLNLYGNDAASLKVTTARVRKALSTIPSIEHITDPMEDGIPEWVF